MVAKSCTKVYPRLCVRARSGPGSIRVVTNLPHEVSNVGAVRIAQASGTSRITLPL